MLFIINNVCFIHRICCCMDILIIDNTIQHNMYVSNIYRLIIIPTPHRDVIRYCFGPVIEHQLNDLVIEWNHRRIRKTLTPGGIPEVLYQLPGTSSLYTL